MKTDPLTPPPIPRPPRPRGRVFDVTAPGKALAHPGSRPVLIGHKSSAQASQTKLSGIGAADSHESMVSAHHQISLRTNDEHGIAFLAKPSEDHQPVSVKSTVASPELTTKSLQPPQSSALTAAALAPSQDSVPKPADVHEDALTAVAMEPEAPAPPESKVEPAPLPAPEPASDDPLLDVIEPSLSHQVVVSPHSKMPPSSAWKLVGLILLIILFIVLILDILLDAGVMTSSIPHTHFF